MKNPSYTIISLGIITENVWHICFPVKRTPFTPDDHSDSLHENENANKTSNMKKTQPQNSVRMGYMYNAWQATRLVHSSTLFFCFSSFSFLSLPDILHAVCCAVRGIKRKRKQKTENKNR